MIQKKLPSLLFLERIGNFFAFVGVAAFLLPALAALGYTRSLVPLPALRAAREAV